MDLRGWLTIPVVVTVLISGCALPNFTSQQQAMTQLATQEKKTNLNQQIANLGAQAAVKGPQDYHLGSEDLLEIGVFGQQDLQRLVRVNGKGEIAMPLVGPVSASGLTPQQLERRLEELYGAQYLRNPQVSVFVKEYRHSRVALTGALKKPGFYEIIGPRTLLEMLATAEGLDEKAGDRVQIIRTKGAKKETPGSNLTGASQPFTPNSETIVIDLRQLASQGKPNVVIQSGDVINVPFAGLAYVLGSVNKPGSVPVKSHLTVSQAIAVAGSPVAGMAKPQNTTILRVDDQGQAVSIPVDLSAIMAKQEPDIVLQEQDVVFVPESTIRRFLLDFKNLVGGGMSVGYSVI
jgi:polysaccharide export outer membrane protein